MQDNSTQPNSIPDSTGDNSVTQTSLPNNSPPQINNAVGVIGTGPVYPPEQHSENPGAGLIVLQWLTYAFWGWTVLGMSTLTVITLQFYIDNNPYLNTVSAYAVAAVLVLLPISIVAEFFFSKKETAKKRGVSSAIMIIHAVIFALFGIGAIITAVFAVVSMIISADSMQGKQVTLISALIITLLYVLTFIRTLIPEKIFKFRFLYPIAMSIIVVIIVGLSIGGPIMQANVTRNDKLIANNLNSVNTAITRYVDDNNKLPDSLTTLNLSGDAKKLITDNLVVYKDDGKVSIKSNYSSNSYQVYFRYQLCVVYKQASSNDKYSIGATNQDYSEFLYVSEYNYHPAGEYCYKLQTKA